MPAISIQTQIHPKGWIMVPVSVCGVWYGHFMLNTFTPISSVSRATATTLEAFQCLRPRTNQGHVLSGLTIGDERFADLPVRVSRAATMLDVEGMLGLDFLRRFASIHFDLIERTLILELL